MHRLDHATAAALLRELSATPWGMQPEHIATLIGSAVATLRTDAPSAAAGRNAVARGVVRAGAVAVVPIRGVIAHHASVFETLFGIGNSVETIKNRIDAALSSNEVGAVVLDIDSPGGTVSGVPEIAAHILASRGAKPIVSVANAHAASAAYWIATAADEVVVTPSGEVGSIGVWTAHVDISEFEKNLGVKTTLISAGKFKVEANPFEPLTDEARVQLQSEVDAFNDMFVKSVAKGRGVTAAAVRSDFGEGRMVLAKDALAAGMADRVATLEDTVRRLAGAGAGHRRRRTARRMAFV